MVSVEEDDLAGLEDVSSDGEDDNYEVDLTDSETVPSGVPAARKPYRKRARVDTSEPLPLMEGEGRSFRVLGFNQNQRALFVQILMRFGVGDFDWAEFTPRLKQKSYEEIKEYGRLFLSHIAEEISDSLTFSDGVPKEGLRIQDVLVRIAQLLLVRDKVRAATRDIGVPLFAHDIISRFPALKSGRLWTEEHDLLLLRAVLKHGYGRWQAIVDDKELKIQEVICKELNLPIVTLPVSGAAQGQAPHLSAQEVSQAHNLEAGVTQAQTTANLSGADTVANQVTGAGNDNGTGVAPGTSDSASHSQAYQESTILYHFREMQRKQVEFIKKRVLLLEKALTAEYQKEYFADEKPNEMPSDDMATGSRFKDVTASGIEDSQAQLLNHLPQVEVFSPEEISAAACDVNSDRLDITRIYNEMCKVLSENAQYSIEAYVSDELASLKLRENLLILEALGREMNQILLPVENDQKQEILRCGSSSAAGAESLDAVESFPESEKSTSPSDSPTMVSSSAGGTGPGVSSSNGAVDTDMEEKEDGGAGEPGVIVLEG